MHGLTAKQPPTLLSYLIWDDINKIIDISMVIT